MRILEPPVPYYKKWDKEKWNDKEEWHKDGWLISDNAGNLVFYEGEKPRTKWTTRRNNAYFRGIHRRLNDFTQCTITITINNNEEDSNS